MQVSTSTSPVTQVAEVAVKKAFSNVLPVSCWMEMGRQSSNVPKKITPQYSNKMICVVDKCRKKEMIFSMALVVTPF